MSTKNFPNSACQAITMFFVSRTRQRIKIAGIVIAVYVSIVGVLAALFPEHSAVYSETFLRWLVGLPIVLIIWFGLEWAGTKFLSLPFWQRLPSIVRVPLLVVGIVVVITAAMIAAQLANAL